MTSVTATLCDKRGCPAIARETWQSPTTGLDVVLCRHHGREAELTLHAQGFRLVEASKVPA